VIIPVDLNSHSAVKSTFTGELSFYLANLIFLALKSAPFCRVFNKKREEKHNKKRGI